MKRMKIGLVGMAFAAMSCTTGGYGGGGGLGMGGAGGGEAAGGAGGGLSEQCRGDFGATAAAQKIEAFLTAAGDFMGTAAQLEQDLLGACTRMGHDLGLSDAELAPQAGETPVQAACTRTAQRLREDMATVQSAANVRVQIVTRPPECRVSVNAVADCLARCDASFQPGSAEIRCEGGELRGRCDAQCQGSCAVEADGQCSGACEGTCAGSCTGTCNGACDGQCSARGADGQCAGSCQGTCRGTCTSGCTGSCTGHCVVRGQASCQGECRGGCSVAFREPYCTGRVEPPRVDADCRASCNAEVSAHADCTPGEARVNIEGSLSGDAEQRANRVRNAINGNLGAILLIGERLRQLWVNAQTLVQTGQSVPSAIGTLGAASAQATACVGQASAGIVRAVASVNVSVQVSVQVSASASGSVASR